MDSPHQAAHLVHAHIERFHERLEQAQACPACGAPGSLLVVVDTLLALTTR
ncbi:MAG TPA: hypothetical protein VJ757_04240 [Pseudonocardiaceae bacterium]|nr:hypothetical protein [Pseudonocardiaceae bacterium]